MNDDNGEVKKCNARAIFPWGKLVSVSTLQKGG